MTNKSFSQLTDTEKSKKFDCAVRNRTGNILNAERLCTLVAGISTNRQYIIIIHPTKQEICEALLDEDVLHIYIPKHLIINERI